MEGDQEPFPKMLFVNEAFLRTKALDLSMTKEEIEQKGRLQSDDFRFQNVLTHRVKTEGCELGNSLCGHSNEDSVELQNENNERDYKLINDSNQIKCESEIQVDTDSLVSNNAVNIEMKVKSNEEESFVTDSSDKIKVEIDGCDDFESNVLYPLESEKEHNQASSNDCNEIKLEKDEEGDVSFSSTSHTTNTDGNQVIHHDVSNSNKQIKLEDCSGSVGPKPDEITKDLCDSSEIKIPSTFTSNHDMTIDSEKKDNLNQKMRFQSGDKTDTLSEGHNGIIENVGLVNQETKSTCDDSVEALNLHTGEKPYKCTVCVKTFTHKTELTRHMRLHTGKKPHQCTVCGETFSRKVNLTVHMRLHTGERPYQCIICNKTFTQNSHLTTHMRHHTGEKPYQCTVCYKTYSNGSDLTRHMRFHTGEKHYQCSVCVETFFTKSYLTIHMRLHTGERPFKCTFCTETFSQNSHLSRHMRNHTGEKPYHCIVCDKAFTQNYNLTRHMSVHTREKHKCTVCDKTFSRSGDLSRHMKLHTGEKNTL